MLITPAYVATMADYNAWQNDNIFGAAGRLTDAARTSDRGAFFKSIHATLNHLLWADQMWLMRFKAGNAPAAKTIAEGLEQYGAWDTLVAERKICDDAIKAWAARVTDADIAAELKWYSGGAGRDMVTPMNIAVTHLFNHQTHHRGQVHCMLTGLGVKPGLTDLPFMDLA
ncbi:MAG: DinB family protein [Hyphomicrobium sp.]